ncbi:FAD-dependent oxidoreductase [Rhizobium leguminosarum]|uniref:FAD-dependent oxidoreductase n=1 Tax=Rhizobium leguminosarum TaxID=384 RepID=UPI001C90578A|nr:FAD-dependent oxidoreductase [Rhizobium leguminosarum]MBY2997829.1 FAD-dependent oxidoreductase [Rhizobium leguminosarum]
MAGLKTSLRRGVSLGALIALGGAIALPGGGGGAPAEPITFTYQTATATLAAALPSVPRENRKKSMDRLVWRGQQTGKTWWSKLVGLYIADPEGLEADWLINWKSPGTFNLTKVGSPTFNSTGYFTTSANTAYYETGIPLQSLPQNSFSFGFFSETSGLVGDVAMGAQDAGGIGISIAAKLASNFANFRAMSTAVSTTTSAPFSGLGFTGITRDGATSVRISRHGVKKETFATASATPATNPTIRIGGAAGNSSFSQRRIRCAYVCNSALTEAEEADMCSAIRDYLDKTRVGHINYFNPAADSGVVSADVVVYGGSIAAMCAAYEAKRQGRSVAILGDWLARTDWDLAGMPGGGLGFIDASSFGAVSGIFREMLKWINTVYYARADSSTQLGLSVESKAWVAAVRRMLDGSKTTGTLPGLDIPVYFSQGVTAAAPYGSGGEITTTEGRKFRGTRVIEAGYEGQLVKLANLPYITGSEVKGTGGEAFNGYLGNTGMALPVSSVGGAQLIDPYVTPATPASGLLPDLIPLPGLTPGDPDPAIQGINYRLGLTNTGGDSAIYDTSPPPNYNALRYEALGRLYAANPTEPFGNNVMKTDLVNGANAYDINNGTSRLSTDVAQSGVNYALATTDAQRLAIIKDVRDYTRGFFYWHLSSGDSRIPAALKTAMAAYQLDGTTFLDPGDEGVLFWPNRAYIRDPVYQLKNTGFVHTGADFYNVVNGSALRSSKTVSVASYMMDRHSIRHIAADLGSGVVIYSEGGQSQSGFGGTNGRSPIALEAIVPDKATNQWLIVPVAASITKVVQYFYRMEFTISLAGQSAGMIAAISIEDGVAVQDIDYTKFRTRMLATPDSVPPVLPQVN